MPFGMLMKGHVQWRTCLRRNHGDEVSLQRGRATALANAV